MWVFGSRVDGKYSNFEEKNRWQLKSTTVFFILFFLSIFSVFKVFAFPDLFWKDNSRICLVGSSFRTQLASGIQDVIRSVP